MPEEQALSRNEVGRLLQLSVSRYSSGIGECLSRGIRFRIPVDTPAAFTWTISRTPHWHGGTSRGSCEGALPSSLSPVLKAPDNLDKLEGPAEKC